MDILPAHEQLADERLADTQLKALFRRKLAEFTKTLDEREEDIPSQSHPVRNSAHAGGYGRQIWHHEGTDQTAGGPDHQTAS